MNKLEFSYTAAKKFIASPDFNNLPWIIESEDTYFQEIKNVEEWKKTFGSFMVDEDFGIMNNKDKEDLLTILQEFVDRVDSEYKLKSRKRR